MCQTKLSTCGLPVVYIYAKMTATIETIMVVLSAMTALMMALVMMTAAMLMMITGDDGCGC